jgi:hypothetical protein
MSNLRESGGKQEGPPGYIDPHNSLTIDDRILDYGSRGGFGPGQLSRGSIACMIGVKKEKQ